jgi:hypothetical protein
MVDIGCWSVVLCVRSNSRLTDSLRRGGLVSFKLNLLLVLIHFFVVFLSRRSHQFVDTLLIITNT